VTVDGAASPSAWTTEHVAGPAAELHAGSADLVASAEPAPARRRLRVMEATRPAVVLGSTQPLDHVDREALAGRGWDLARRRSGGGAVLVGTGDVAWVDVVVPREDPLWDDDVRRGGLWLGECWRQALTRVGVPSAEVWTAGLVRRPWSGRVCFAGLGPGEVTLAGRKVVGVSQRRTRRGVLLQSAALLRWSAPDLLGVLEFETPARRQAAAADLEAVAVGLGRERGDGLVAALREEVVARSQVA
jgi:lipoate-protein ligase A